MSKARQGNKEVKKQAAMSAKEKKAAKKVKKHSKESTNQPFLPQ